MGRKKKKKVPAIRMAKMVSADTAQLIDELRDRIAKEQHRDSRVIDNEVIKLAVMEAIEARK